MKLVLYKLNACPSLYVANSQNTHAYLLIFEVPEGGALKAVPGVIFETCVLTHLTRRCVCVCKHTWCTHARHDIFFHGQIHSSYMFAKIRWLCQHPDTQTNTHTSTYKSNFLLPSWVGRRQSEGHGQDYYHVYSRTYILMLTLARHNNIFSPSRE
jgi:hypothetical protein